MKRLAIALVVSAVAALLVGFGLCTRPDHGEKPALRGVTHSSPLVYSMPLPPAPPTAVVVPPASSTPTTVPVTAAPSESATTPNQVAPATVPQPVAPAPTTTTAPAPSSSDADQSGWQAVSRCEEGGANDPTYGYFGILPSSWQAYGGGRYSSTAGGASWDEQVQIAEAINGSPPDESGGCHDW